MKKGGSRDRTFLFVGGAHGRTGTTLMKRLLCAHPNITPAVPGETRLLEAIAYVRPRLREDSLSYTPARAADSLVAFEAAIRDGFGNAPFVARAIERLHRRLGAAYIRGARLPVRAHVPSAKHAVLDRALGALAGDLLAGSAPDAARCVCEKTPSNAQYVALILAIRPDARIVVMVRDPVAVALSHTRRPWGPRDPVEAAAYSRLYFDRWRSVRSTVGEAVLVVALEHLVSRPREVMGAVMRHIGVGPSTAVLSRAEVTVRRPEDRRSTVGPRTAAEMAAAIGNPVLRDTPTLRRGRLRSAD